MSAIRGRYMHDECANNFRNVQNAMEHVVSGV